MRVGLCVRGGVTSSLPLLWLLLPSLDGASLLLFLGVGGFGWVLGCVDVLILIGFCGPLRHPRHGVALGCLCLRRLRLLVVERLRLVLGLEFVLGHVPGHLSVGPLSLVLGGLALRHCLVLLAGKERCPSRLLLDWPHLSL